MFYCIFKCAISIIHSDSVRWVLTKTVEFHRVSMNSEHVRSFSNALYMVFEDAFERIHTDGTESCEKCRAMHLNVFTRTAQNHVRNVELTQYAWCKFIVLTLRCFCCKMYFKPYSRYNFRMNVRIYFFRAILMSIFQFSQMYKHIAKMCCDKKVSFKCPCKSTGICWYGLSKRRTRPCV